VAGVTDASVIGRFTNHVFLAPAGNAYVPRYEVLRVYFIARFLALALSTLKGKGDRAAIARLLALNKTGKTQVIEWLVLQLKRLQRSDPKKLVAAIHHAVEIIHDNENKENQKAASMALFHLVINLLSSDEKKERLRQMAELLVAETQDDKIRFERIGLAGTVRAFDFSNVEFVRCWFENVEFRNCIFSERSAFLSCSFEGTLDFASCDGLKKFAVREPLYSREAEYAFDEIRGTGVKEATKRTFAEEALSRALRKFKGDFGFNSIQYRYRKGGFRAGNPYNETIWEALLHCGIIQRHHISNVDEGGLNVVDDKEVRREIAFYFDNGVLGRRLDQVVAEVIR